MKRPNRNPARRRSANAPVTDDEPETRGPSRDGQARARQERLLDEGIEESFPASDPVSVFRLT